MTTVDTELERRLHVWLAGAPSSLDDARAAAIVAAAIGERQRRPLRIAGLVLAPSLWRTGLVAAGLLLVLTVGVGEFGNRLAGQPGVVSPGPVASPAVVDLVTANVTFDPDITYAPAGVPITLEFVDRGPSVPHGLELADATGHVVFRAEVAIGSRTWQLPALVAGTYSFLDPVHPSMTGTLLVGADAVPETRPPSASALAPGVTGLRVDATGFYPAVLRLPAGRRAFVELQNLDPFAAHGLELLNASGAVVLKAGSAQPLGTFGYPIDALPAGTYTIRDPQNHALTGTLVLAAGG